MRFVHLFEAIKNNSFTSINDYLTKDEIILVYSWFCKYSSLKLEKISLEKIIDLMYYLYIFEDIDLYTLEEYTKVVESISEKYGITKKDFINLFSDYKKMVFKG